MKKTIITFQEDKTQDKEEGETDIILNNYRFNKK